MQPKIFVFGSNLQGIHGAGAALTARLKWGAQLGVGVGRTGDSYAIPTKETPYKTLPIDRIKEYVDEFLMYTWAHPQYQFLVTPIGCGLAGYKPHQIAPLFLNTTVSIPGNIVLPREFEDYFNATD